MCHGVSHNLLFCPNSFTCGCSFQWVTELVWGFCLLLRYQYWILTSTPLRILCPGDPAALLLQAWSLHLLQQFLDRVDVRVNQLKALYLSLDGTWISPTVLPHCPGEAKGHLFITHISASRQGLGQLSHSPRSIVLAAQVMGCPSLPSAEVIKGWGISLPFTHSGTMFLYCPGKGKVQLSYLWLPSRGRDNSLLGILLASDGSPDHKHPNGPHQQHGYSEGPQLRSQS